MRLHHPLITLLVITASTPCHARQQDTRDASAGRDGAPSGQDAASSPGDPVSELDMRIFVVFQAKDGTYWFGSDGQGVYRYDGKAITHFTTKHGLRGNRIRSIQQDRAGNILVSGDGGPSRFDGRAFRALNALNTDPAKGEWKLNPDDLWFIGWQDEGVVYRYDGTALHRLAFPTTKPGEEHIAKFPRSKFPAMAFNPYDTYTIFKDSQGHVWFGTGVLGVCRYDGTSFAWASKNELDFGDDNAFGVRSIIEDEGGKFWFSRTLHRFDVEPTKPGERGNAALGYRKEPGIAGVKEDSDPSTFFISAVKDKNGDLWLATLGRGVWRYDGKSMTNYPVQDADKGVWINSIYKDNHDDLWLGTHEHGVYKFNGSAFEKARF